MSKMKKACLFLCEMGLDPGIDHMSAMQLIHQIQQEGGRITSFKSHCGGLVAPESDDNPWHYKISWNPRNIIMAGKAGARYKENNKEVSISYEQLFDSMLCSVTIPGLGVYSWYPNRDSLRYAALYRSRSVETFIRTTLRHPEFCFGWKNLIELKLQTNTVFYDTDNMTIHDFFNEHFEKYGFGEWLNEMLTSRLTFAKQIMENLTQLQQAEDMIKKPAIEEPEEMMMVGSDGELAAMDVEAEKSKAAEVVAAQNARGQSYFKPVVLSRS